MTGVVVDLFGGQYSAGPALPRPAVDNPTCEAEFVQVEMGVWTIVVYALIPRLGTQHLHFPHFFGGPPERPVWRVARHGELPGGTFLFDSREQATEIAALVFRGATDLYRFMSVIEVPSDDHRRRRPPT